MRFFLELDDEENLFACKKICDALIFAKNRYTQPFDSSKIKFNLNAECSLQISLELYSSKIL